MTELQQVFQALGFLSHPTDFSRAVPYADLRKELEGRFRGSSVSTILRHMPDLFAVNEKLEKGICFVKDISAGKPTAEALEVYRKFYPKDILFVRVQVSGATKRFSARWIEDPKEGSIPDALQRRFGAKPTKEAIAGLAAKGWIL